MITVRFPSGLSLQYNNLYFVTWGLNTTAYLHEKENEGWLVCVDVSGGALIELTRPCRAYMCQGDKDGDRIEHIYEAIPKIERKITKLSTAERKRRRTA